MDKSGGGEGAAAFVVYLMSMGTVCLALCLHILAKFATCSHCHDYFVCGRLVLS